MPLFESEHEKRSRIYREQQASIAKNTRRQTEMMEEDRRAARNAAYRARERAAKARRRETLLGLGGAVAGAATWALQKDAERQARLREQAATGATPGNPMTPQTPPAAQPVYTEAPATASTGEPTLFDLPDDTSTPSAAFNASQGQQAAPVTSAQGINWASLPWGIFSVVAAAIFFFAPVTSIAGIVLGIIGLRYNSNGTGIPLQRTLSLVGIAISSLILLGMLAIVALNAVLSAIAGALS